MVMRSGKTKCERKRVPRDVILPMQEPYMQQIVSGQKTYEYRKYRIASQVERIWFYRTAPHSSIEYICEILPARTRGPGDAPLDENGLGNKEFNDGHEDYVGYDYAYKIVSVYQLKQPVTLADLRHIRHMKSAPRGLVYTPQSLLERVNWKVATKLL